MEKFKSFIGKFTPYIEDIRRRLYWTGIIFFVVFGLGFFLTTRILKILLAYFNIKDVIIATTSPFQFADLSINIGLFAAFFITSPIILFHLIAFLTPALTKKEKRLIFLIVPTALFLFVFGFTYGFLIMYYAMVILAEVNTQIGIQNIWDIGAFLSQIILTSTLLGALFQFPIVFSFIIRTGIVSVEYLRSKRRLTIVLIFTFTALLPPTDGLSLIAMALPLILLYEVTIFVNSKFGRQKLLN